MLFLDRAELLYPDLKTSLLTLAKDFEEDTYNGFVYEFQRETPLGHWCTRWNLVSADGLPAPWALRAAYQSLSFLILPGVRMPDKYFVWGVTGGGASPDRPSNESTQFNPVMQTLASAKDKDSHRRIPRSEFTEATATISEYLALGWKTSPTIQNPHKVDWAVHCSVGGLKPEELAEKLFPGLQYERLISKEICKFRAQMGWPAKRGRR